VFETKTQRRAISETIDEITSTVSKLKLADITKEYDKYCTALRKVDASIQQANWTAECEFTLPEGIEA